MVPDKQPATKADLDVLRAELRAMHDLLENEFRHLREDVNTNTTWRLQFTGENGPWRRVADSVKVTKVFIGVLSPIAIWAIIEIVKTAVVAWRGNP